VAALIEPGHGGGGEISGFHVQDRMLMGLLRAAADAVVVGAGTLRADPVHRWTAPYIFPALTEAYHALRSALGKSSPALNVIVTARGEIDPTLPVFQSGEAPALIVTTPRGMQRIRSRNLPEAVRVITTQATDTVSARDVVEAIMHTQGGELILVEGGPRLMGDFFAEQRLDELFLTLAPQVAGRDGIEDARERPGFVAGKVFAPDIPLWGTLMTVHRGGSHLFLRYGFDTLRSSDGA
jgi:riboflavin biosynthesis pyrimidine reductase